MRRQASLLALLLASAPPAFATQGPALNAAAPFATNHLALQLSDGRIAKQKLIVSVANSVLKRYGPDRVSIVVVAFGPGVALLYANSPERAAVDSLIAQGVQFDVCMNTINTIKRKTGNAPALDPKARRVPYGVPRLMALAKRGYTIVRP